MKIINYIDIFSPEIKLKIQNGQSNFKTQFGGVLSLLCFISVFAAVFYFFLRFINRKDATIITNEELTNQVKIENFNQYPFMIRLTNSYSVPIKDPYKYYEFYMSYMWTVKNKTESGFSNVIMLEHIDLQICDINNSIHFNENYKYLFENYTDINTFLCPNYKKNYTVSGLYGDVNFYSYMHFHLRACQKESSGNRCYDPETINSTLTTSYLEFRTVNYEVNTLKVNPKNLLVLGERIFVSNTVYKRIWMYYKSLNFTSDFGYVFENYETDNFFQVSRYEFETDMRNSSKAPIPYTFLGLTIINDKSTLKFRKTYMKFQNMLANIGGIINGILIIGFLLNYIISVKLFNSFLINHIPEIKYQVFHNFSENLEYDSKNFINSKKSAMDKVDKNNYLNSNKVDDNNNLNFQEKQDKFKFSNSKLIDNERNSFDENNESNLDKNNNNKFDNKLDNSKLNLDINKFKTINNVKAFNQIGNKEFESISKPNQNLSVKSDFINDNLFYKKYVNYHMVENQTKVQLDNYQLICFDFCYSKKNMKFKIYESSKKLLMEELDISNILNKLSQIEKMKHCLLTMDQLTLFNYIFQSKKQQQEDENVKYKHNIKFEEFKASKLMIEKKTNKENFDNYILTILKKDS